MPLNLKESTLDWFVCMCGNSPASDGFYTCLPSGKIVSPSVTDGNWDEEHIICAGCNAIYNQNEMTQVGTATHPSVIHHNNYYISEGL